MGKKSKKKKNGCVVKEAVLCDEGKAAEKLSQKAPPSSRFSADELLQKADEFIDVFEYELARKFCQRAIEIQPDSVRALETYGFLELQGGDLDRAKSCFTRATELQPDVGHSKYMYLGQMATGHEAIQFFLKGINIMKKSLASQNPDVGASVAEVGNASNKSEISARDVSSAYCAIAEIYMTDACDEADADIRCKENLDFAAEADASNAETYHILASYWLCKGENEKANEAMDKGISLWLPQLRSAVKPEGATPPDPVEVCSISYPARISCAKTLIELEKFDTASEVLELLLDENDEVVEVWYLLGLLNYLQGADFKNNAQHYLKKGLEVAAKLQFDDTDMLSQMNELMSELGPAECNSDDETEECKVDDEEMEAESDSEDDDVQENEQVTQMDQ